MVVPVIKLFMAPLFLLRQLGAPASFFNDLLHIHDGVFISMTENGIRFTHQLAIPDVAPFIPAFNPGDVPGREIDPLCHSLRNQNFVCFGHGPPLPCVVGFPPVPAGNTTRKPVIEFIVACFLPAGGK